MCNVNVFNGRYVYENWSLVKLRFAVNRYLSMGELVTVVKIEEFDKKNTELSQAQI